jgi:hypothetical protein
MFSSNKSTSSHEAEAGVLLSHYSADILRGKPWDSHRKLCLLLSPSITTGCSALIWTCLACVSGQLREARNKFRAVGGSRLRFNRSINLNLKLKSTIFWDITPCNPLKLSRRFGGTYRLHLHPSKKPALLVTCFHAVFFLGLFFDTEDGGDIFLRNIC